MAEGCSESVQKFLSNPIDNPKYRELKTYIARFRNNITFHYDEGSSKLISIALKDRSERAEVEAWLSKVTSGDDILRFGFADDIIDSIVCRQIWNIPREETDLREEADKIVVEMSDFCESFVKFSSEFIFKFLKDHAMAS